MKKDSDPDRICDITLISYNR